jgi:hypothetical protein
MMVSKSGSQWLHTALIGFCTGALSYLSAIVVGAPLPGIRALVVAVLVSGFSRMAGALLAKINTPANPPI